MTLFRTQLSDPGYQKAFRQTDIRQFEVYTLQNEKLGQVNDVLVDEAGRSFLGVDVGFWEAGKQVLMPLGRLQVSPGERRIYVDGLSKSQASHLPTYDAAEVVDRSISQTSYRQSYVPAYPVAVEDSAPLENSVPLERDVTAYSTLSETPIHADRIEARPVPPVAPAPPVSPYPVATDTLQERFITAPAPTPKPGNVVAEERIRLLDERVVVDSRRRKIGEVIVRKEIETYRVEVPVRREKLIVEQVSPEHKQIAIIDLGQQELSRSSLGPGIDPDIVEDASAATFSEEMTIQAASQFLAEVSDRLQGESARVRITIKNPGLRKFYQQWQSSRNL